MAYSVARYAVRNTARSQRQWIATSSAPTARNARRSKRYWDKVEERVDRMTQDVPDADSLGDYFADFVAQTYDRADSLYENAIAAMFFPNGDIVVEIISAVLTAIYYKLCATYQSVPIQFWLDGLRGMNHGQMVITLMAYLPAIGQHNDYAQDNWHYVEPQYYITELLDAFDQDVWARAFTDVSDAPLPHMEAIVALAEHVSELIYDLGIVSNLGGPSISRGKMGRAADGSWHRLTDDPSAPKLEVVRTF